ncbi:MAG: MFS transporter [Myxococcota bacterium]
MNPSRLLLALMYAAFVSLGLPDGAFGVAWPAMRAELGQPLEALGLVTLLWTTCSALSGLVSARVLEWLGTLTVVLASGLVTGLCLLGFAWAPTFAVVVALALPFGFGAGSVDAGLNHHAAAHYRSRHMNWLHAAWGVGATLGPLAVTAAVSAGRGWRLGYVVISAAQLLLVVLLFLSRRLWESAPVRSEVASETGAVAVVTRAEPPVAALILAPLTYALYVGAEGGVGLWAASVLREGRGFDASLAGSLASIYFAAITLGRVISGLVSDHIGNRTMVRCGLALASLGVMLFALPLGVVGAFAGLVLVGLGFAPIYPCLMHETARRFDAPTAAKVIGRQVAFAYLGGMLLPPLIGVAAGKVGLWVVAPLVLSLVAILALCVVLLDKKTPLPAVEKTL